jgi:hypothetical protein
VINGGAQLPAYTFDPLMMEAFESFNKEWTKLCFVQGVTNVDLDQNGSYMLFSPIQQKIKNEACHSYYCINWNWYDLCVEARNNWHDTWGHVAISLHTSFSH